MAQGKWVNPGNNSRRKTAAVRVRYFSFGVMTSPVHATYSLNNLNVSYTQEEVYSVLVYYLGFWNLYHFGSLILRTACVFTVRTEAVVVRSVERLREVDTYAIIQAG